MDLQPVVNECNEFKVYLCLNKGSLQVAGGVEGWWNHMPGFSASCLSAVRRIEGRKELERKLEGGIFKSLSIQVPSRLSPV